MWGRGMCNGWFEIACVAQGGNLRLVVRLVTGSQIKLQQERRSFAEYVLID